MISGGAAIVVAYSYPLLGAFLTVLWAVLIVLWAWFLIMAVIDIFGRHDIGGFAKGVWFVGIFLFPFAGAVVYILLRGEEIARRRRRRAAGIDPPFHEWFNEGFDGTGRQSGNQIADELSKLATLRDQGVLTDEEFQRQKAKVLSQ